MFGPALGAPQSGAADEFQPPNSLHEPLQRPHPVENVKPRAISMTIDHR